MVVNKYNANYALVRVVFRGGGVVSYHRTLKAALRARGSYSRYSNYLLADIVPMNTESYTEMSTYNVNYFLEHSKSLFIMQSVKLYQDLPTFGTLGLSSFELCLRKGEAL